MLYLEHESSEWVGFPGPKDAGLVSLPFDQRLRSFARCAATGDAIAARSLVNSLIGESANSSPSDDSLVSHVCALVRQRLDGPITLAALAEVVHRSPSRLAHRFRGATDVPLPRYVLWHRRRAAVEAAMRGSSLTEAAHVAGFADSAHLSRTFRATFGIAPPFLLERSRFSVTFCENAPGIWKPAQRSQD